jgi:cytochrome c oxidase assembly factor CtaG
MRAMKVSSAISRMIQGSITALLLTHITACFWYLTAKFSNFNEDTWVARTDLIEAEPVELYAWAMHWASQTVTTVGYGDIPAVTTAEIIFSFAWMLLGVLFYSFIIGNFTSIVSNSSQINKTIQY